MILYRLEAAALWLALRLAGLLGPAAASDLGGVIARAIGPLLPVSRVADANLRLALPELDGPARARLVRAVWDNLGRTAAEIAHLPALRLELEGAEHIAAVRAAAGPALFFSGHLANWEVLIPAAAAQGVRIAGVYRAAGNPFADALINARRQAASGGVARLFPKGAEGARASLAHLRAGGALALLADQKMNDGIEAPFFGHPAMTPSAAAALALRFRCPLLPAHAERLGPAHLRVVVEAPLKLPDSGDRAADILALTEAINRRLEDWIRARPAEWLWLHRRWPKDNYG